MSTREKGCPQHVLRVSHERGEEKAMWLCSLFSDLAFKTFSATDSLAAFTARRTFSIDLKYTQLIG